MATAHYLTFVELAAFANAAKGVLGDDELRALEATLSADPYAGDVVAETGGVRKVRVALAGRGQSGSARVIYFYRSAKGRIYLMYVYAKNTRANITRAERHALRRRVAQLEVEP